MNWNRLLPNCAPWPSSIDGFKLRESCANCAHINTHREFEPCADDLWPSPQTPPRPFCGLDAPQAPPDGTHGDEALAWFRAMQEHAKTRRVVANGWCPKYTARSISAAGEQQGD
jgi:hypothetical protein